MPLVKRIPLDRPLTFAEGDGNLDYLDQKAQDALDGVSTAVQAAADAGTAAADAQDAAADAVTAAQDAVLAAQGATIAAQEAAQDAAAAQASATSAQSSADNALEIAEDAGTAATSAQASASAAQTSAGDAVAAAQDAVQAVEEFEDDVNAALALKADLVAGKVPSSQLPAYVDDVLEFANAAAFPATGASGIIYIALDTNKTYRWSGSVYVVLSSDLALGETASSAYRGDRGKIAYDFAIAHADGFVPQPKTYTVSQFSTGGTRIDDVALAGFEPVVVIVMGGQEIALNRYEDFNVVPTGGLVLVPTGRVPVMYPDWLLKMYNYKPTTTPALVEDEENGVFNFF